MITGNTTFLNAFLQSLYNAGNLGAAASTTLRCYAGTQPTDAQALNFNPSLFTSELIGTFTNFTMRVVGQALQLNTFPAATTASRAATITWCALMGQNGVGLILPPGVVGTPGSVILNTLDPSNGGQLTLIDAGVCLAF